METYRQGEGQLHQFTGTAPTTRTDGTPLAPGEIDHYVRFAAYRQPDGTWLAPEEMDVQLVDGAFDEIVDIDALAVGYYEYYYQTVDTGGRHSVDSASVGFDVLAPLANPNPPTDIR